MRFCKYLVLLIANNTFLNSNRFEHPAHFSWEERRTALNLSISFLQYISPRAHYKYLIAGGNKKLNVKTRPIYYAKIFTVGRRLISCIWV